VLDAAADRAGAVDQHVEPRQVGDQRAHAGVVAHVERERVARGEPRRGACRVALAWSHR